MYSKAFVKRIGAAALTLTMAVSLLPMARAADPIVDETYYGTLDYYGALTEGAVVKSYRLNGNTDLADIGSYTEVNNLTDRTEPVIEGNRVTFHLTDDSLKSFYFEGKTDKPFREMPFLLSISYKMNGVETDAGDMAGQTGLAEITLDVRPNPLASAYQRNNFALEAAAVLKDSDLLSIEAPGGQLQKVGDLVTALYLVLPGETRSFTLRIGAEDFSFPGFTFMIQPATLAQLDQIKELKEAKEELEGAAQDLSDSMDAILTSLEGMDADLRQTSFGLDRLDLARSVISSGKARVYDQADQTLASLTDLTESLKPVVDTIQTAKTALAENTEQLSALTGLIDELRPDLQDVKTGLTDIQGDLDALQTVLDRLEEDSSQVSLELARLEEDLDTLQTHMARMERTLKDLQQAVDDTGSIKPLTPYSKIPVGDSSYTIQEINDAHDQAETVWAACRAVGYADNGTLTLTERENALAAFIVTNCEAIARALVLGDPNGKAQVEAKAAELTAEKITELTGLSPGDPGYEEAYAVYAPAIYEAVYAQVLAAAAQTYAEKLSNEKQSAQLAFLHYEWTEGTNVKQSLTLVNTFNQIIETVNKEIKELNKQLDDLRDPTSGLLNDTRVLLGDLDGDAMDDMADLLSTARDLIAHTTAYDDQALHDHTSALLSSSTSLLDRVDGIIVQTAALSETLTKYEPDAQAALDDTARQVDAAIGFLENLNTFSKSLEDLMQAAGPDLDQGAAASLQGLSSTLRRMADGLGTTSAVRRAKDTITRLAEDKWEEYTGGENNLLNIDSQAEMVSLTSPENPTPNTITLVLRSQEIKTDEEEEETRSGSDGGQEQETLGFWGRVGRMFHDFVAIFTGD